MKSMITLVAIAIFSLSVTAQTADEIITNYFNKTGGLANWRALQGQQIKTVVIDNGMSIPSTKIYLKDGRVLIKFTLNKQEMVQIAFDGKVAWGDDFITLEPKKNSDETTENMIREAKDFPSPLLNYQQNGYKATLVGQDSVANQLCFKIILNKGKHIVDGEELDNIEYYYISSTDYTLIATESDIQMGQLKGKKRTDIYSNNQEVDGFLFPFSITRNIEDNGSMQINVESIELNPVVDDAVFTFPTNK